MFTPAKINLGLQVHHKREPDGYHYISSIFIPIDFGDDLLIEPAQSAHSLHSDVHLKGPLLQLYNEVSEQGDFQKNILFKVLKKTQSFHENRFYSLKLVKRIPPGGGLGGGSTNAAALLKYLAKHFSIGKKQLASLALSLGADVPFFLQNDCCMVHGIGEHLEPVAVGAGYGVLCISGISVNTAFAYQNLKRTLQATPYPKSLRGLDFEALTALKNSEWSALKALSNDFEAPVFAMHPELQRVKAEFYRHGADLSMMSGSGSVVYALTSTKRDSMELAERMRHEMPGYVFELFEFPYREAGMI